MRCLTYLLFLSSALFATDVLTEARSCSSQSEETYALLDQLAIEHQIIETGSDDLRIKYVNAQGCIEHILACKHALGEIHDLVGIIHTPMPATPLCVKPEGPFPSVIDPEKLHTVLSRAQILREYLAKGSKLLIVYPKGGLEKRTAEQQQIYRELLSQFSNLTDWPISSEQIPPDMIGATYLFLNKDNEVYAFSIKAAQINDQQPQAEWGIWFGPLSDEKILVRVQTILNFLSSVGGLGI